MTGVIRVEVESLNGRSDSAMDTGVQQRTPAISWVEVNSLNGWRVSVELALVC